MIKVNGLSVSRIPVNGKETLRVMKNGEQLWSGTGLPAGYTLLEYIESTGAAYLDTGVLPAENIKVEITHETDYTYLNTLFGADWSTTGFFLILHVGDVRHHTRGVSYDFVGAPSGKATYIATTNSITVNGVTETWSEGSSSDVQRSIYLFRANGTTNIEYGKGKVYGIKMWYGDSLIRDFIPCMNPSGVCGLYDKVNKRFYGSASATGFTGA